MPPLVSSSKVDIHSDEAVPVEVAPVEGGTAVKARGYWELVWIRFKRDRMALASVGFIIFLLVMAFIGGPVFSRILGHGPNDIFPYGVDQHTLAVLRNLAAFASGVPDPRFAIAHEVWPRLRKPELLLLAGLFHDIAKGRGGDHSELGAVDARAFCTAHGLGEADTAELIATEHGRYVLRRYRRGPSPRSSTGLAQSTARASGGSGSLVSSACGRGRKSVISGSVTGSSPSGRATGRPVESYTIGNGSPQ